MIRFAPYTGIHLNVTDLELSVNYYKKLGMVADESIHEEKDFKHLKFNDFDYFTLALSEVPSVTRGEAFGRVAFSCADHDV